MIVTVFRTRLNSGVQDEYCPTAERMSELAQAVPSYISHKGFVADDGERVTIVEFESEEALHKWRINPEHGAAKKRGFDSFYSEFKYQICSVIRGHGWLKRRSERLMDRALRRSSRRSRGAFGSLATTTSYLEGRQ